MTEQLIDRLIQGKESQGASIGSERKMFTCIACTKQTEEGGEGDCGAARGGGSGTPRSKEAVKSLTTQACLSLSYLEKYIMYIFFWIIQVV